MSDYRSHASHAATNDPIASSVLVGISFSLPLIAEAFLPFFVTNKSCSDRSAASTKRNLMTHAPQGIFRRVWNSKKRGATRHNRWPCPRSSFADFLDPFVEIRFNRVRVF